MVKPIKSWRSPPLSANFELDSWWSMADSNRRPLARQASAEEFARDNARLEMHHRRTSATVLCRSNCGPPAGRAADGHLAGPHTMGIPWHRGTERALNQERAFRDEVQATR